MSGENSGSSYPALDATSPTDSVIAGDFGSLSAQEQERQRDEWKAELAKTEEEIITLKQVRFSGNLITAIMTFRDILKCSPYQIVDERLLKETNQ